MNGKTGGAQSEAAHRAVGAPVAGPGARPSSAVRGKRWATVKELSVLAGIVVAAVGVLLGGTQWAVSSALETTLTFAVSPLREDLRAVQVDARSLREGQTELRERLVRVETLLEPDGSSSDGGRRAGDVRPGVPGLGGTESHPG